MVCQTTKRKFIQGSCTLPHINFVQSPEPFCRDELTTAANFILVQDFDLSQKEVTVQNGKEIYNIMHLVSIFDP